MEDFRQIPYRIRVGVTGHRALDDPGEIAQRVNAALDDVLRILSRPVPGKPLSRVQIDPRTLICLEVLSPLAEGADRLVATAALARPDATLQAVLPLLPQDYIEDFAAESSKQEFLRLLALCRRPVVLRALSIADECLAPDGKRELRRGAYRAAGEFVVDHCDVLIAVWNGEPARGMAGSAEIVDYALKQGRPVIRVWSGVSEQLNPEACNGFDAPAFAAIDHFNRQPITEARRAEYACNLERDLFEKASSAAIPAQTREMVNRYLLPYYAQASIVAKLNRDAFHRAGRSIYLLSAAAVACAAVGVLFRPLAALGYAAELALLLVMIVTLRQARRGHAHQTWIEYRFLTERIRAGIFMAVCGVEPRPIEVLPYMGHSQTVNDWTVRVFAEIWSRLPPLKGCTAENLAAVNQYVRETWIEEQIGFHRKKALREGRWRRRLAQAGSIVLPVTVAAAAAHLVLLGWEPGAGAAPSLIAARHALHQGLAFVALLFPAIAASLAGMEAHREHLRLERRSENMAPQLRRLCRQFESAHDPERFTALLHQADELMLRETQDWLMLMRFVEIKAS